MSADPKMVRIELPADWYRRILELFDLYLAEDKEGLVEIEPLSDEEYIAGMRVMISVLEQAESQGVTASWSSGECKKLLEAEIAEIKVHREGPCGTCASVRGCSENTVLNRGNQPPTSDPRTQT